MNIQHNHFYVITGGPGVGKTALLHELEKQGIAVVAEDARRIIREQIATNGDALPWKNKVRYAQLMFEEALKTYDDVVNRSSSIFTFFDRGLLDTICYMKMEDIAISEDVEKLILQQPYARTVFLLPPWKEIYETDNERKQNWEEARYTFEKMKETYLYYGYDTVEVPKDTVVNRAKYVWSILREINDGSTNR